jgi:hypothetical protein
MEFGIWMRESGGGLIYMIIFAPMLAVKGRVLVQARQARKYYGAL